MELFQKNKVLPSVQYMQIRFERKLGSRMKTFIYIIDSYDGINSLVVSSPNLYFMKFWIGAWACFFHSSVPVQPGSHWYVYPGPVFCVSPYSYHYG